MSIGIEDRLNRARNIRPEDLLNRKENKLKREAKNQIVRPPAAFGAAPASFSLPNGGIHDLASLGMASGAGSTLA